MQTCVRAYARTSYANSNYNLLIHFSNVASIITPMHRGCNETRPDRLINNCIVSAELVHHIQGETAPSASRLTEVSTAAPRASRSAGYETAPASGSNYQRK